MNTLLQDKVILVTGRSSGIGRATAVALSRAGGDAWFIAMSLFCDVTSFIQGHSLPIDGGLLAQ